jgi:hypothetical protein
MMLVMLFIVLFLSFWSLAYRWTAAALRIEATRSLQASRDEGTVHAVARAVALFETGLPPQSPYTCAVTITTSAGSSRYTVVMTSTGNSTWTVAAAPTDPNDDPPDMPDSFLP